jgi:hypothetical protein
VQIGLFLTLVVGVTSSWAKTVIDVFRAYCLLFLSVASPDSRHSPIIDDFLDGRVRILILKKRFESKAESS